MKTLRAVKGGEEIYTDYRYSMSKAPQWYKDDLKRFLVSKLNMSEEDVIGYIEKIDDSHIHEERV